VQAGALRRSTRANIPRDCNVVCIVQLHVCGEERMLPLLQLIASSCGDAIQVVRHTRLSRCSRLLNCATVFPYLLCYRLRLEKDAALHEHGVKRLMAGDAVVCFSRKQVYVSHPMDLLVAVLCLLRHLHCKGICRYAIKQVIEQNTGHKCSVVYGQLPPESRREQAKLFNERLGGFDVLVAR
jgi:ATP-dependent RNA helicase SUPV3L1/SUV3